MITVKYFASLRNIAGKDEERFDMGKQTSLENLSNEISKSTPKIGQMILEKKLLVSVNMDVIQFDTIIKDEDEVALLPPFSGGS